MSVREKHITESSLKDADEVSCRIRAWKHLALSIEFTPSGLIPQNWFPRSLHKDLAIFTLRK